MLHVTHGGYLRNGGSANPFPPDAVLVSRRRACQPYVPRPPQGLRGFAPVLASVASLPAAARGP